MLELPNKDFKVAYLKAKCFKKQVAKYLKIFLKKDNCSKQMKGFGKEIEIIKKKKRKFKN